MPVGFGVVDDVLLLTLGIPTQVGVVLVLTVFGNEFVEGGAVVDGIWKHVDVGGDGGANLGIVALPVTVDTLGHDGEKGVEEGGSVAHMGRV